MDRRPREKQIAFYRARAPEYDQSLATRNQLEIVKQSLRAVGPFADVVELACGTGIWTKELERISRAVTAIDASPESIGHVMPFRKCTEAGVFRLLQAGRSAFAISRATRGLTGLSMP